LKFIEQVISLQALSEGGSPQQLALNESVDALRAQYGKEVLVRSGFIASGIPPMAGGLKEGHPGMKNCL